VDSDADDGVADVTPKKRLYVFLSTFISWLLEVHRRKLSAKMKYMIDDNNLL
jgi:hypothetical protein